MTDIPDDDLESLARKIQRCNEELGAACEAAAGLHAGSEEGDRN